MTDHKYDSPADLAPVLTEPAATGPVPVLTDAVVETLAPVLDEPTVTAPQVPEETIDALREALTAIARDITRECVEAVFRETRNELERRLAGQWEDGLRTVVDRVLRDHLAARD
jgi:hypothetical protein